MELFIGLFIILGVLALIFGATEIIPKDGASTVRVLGVTQADTNYSLLRSQCPVNIDNEGATGACIVWLPSDCHGGELVSVQIVTAQNISLNPGASGTILGSDSTAFTTTAAGKTITGDVAGEFINLVSLSGDDWLVQSQGTLTAALSHFNEEEA